MRHRADVFFAVAIEPRKSFTVEDDLLERENRGETVRDISIEGYGSHPSYYNTLRRSGVSTPVGFPKAVAWSVTDLFASCSASLRGS